MTTVHKVEIDLKKIKIKNRHSWLKIIPSRPLRHITDITRQGIPYHHSCYARNVPYQLAAGHSEYQLPWVGLEPRKVLYLRFLVQMKTAKKSFRNYLTFKFNWNVLKTECAQIGVCPKWKLPKLIIAQNEKCSKWNVECNQNGIWLKWNL